MRWLTNENSKVNTESSVLNRWQQWGGSALGRMLFSRFLGFMAPYTGSVKPLVLELEPGRSLVALNDRRFVRNHLNSIHAIALANLGEVASGLAVLAALPENVKAIVTKLEIEYVKKARGTLHAFGSAELPPNITEPTTQIALAEIKDEIGDVVAQVKVHWQLRLKEEET